MIELINGDSSIELDALKHKGVKIDKVMTSPPYNIIRKNNDDRGYDVYNDGMSNEDYIKFTLDIFNKIDGILNKNGAIIYNMSYGTENNTCMSLTVSSIIEKTNFTLGDIIVWKKKTATPNCMSSNKLTRIVEFIYIFVRKNEYSTYTTNKKPKSYRPNGQKNYGNIYNFIEANNNDESTPLNKATYSTDLMQKLFNIYVKPNDVILDPFGGTGTTAICSYLNGNKCYSIELSEEQVNYSKIRLDKIKNDTKDSLNPNFNIFDI